MLWVYDQQKYFIFLTAWTVFIRQNLTSTRSPHWKGYIPLKNVPLEPKFIFLNRDVIFQLDPHKQRLDAT